MKSNWTERVSEQEDVILLPEDFNKIAERLEPEMHKHIDEIAKSNSLTAVQSKALFSYIISHAEMAVYGVSAITAHEETGMFGIRLPRTLAEFEGRLRATARDIGQSLMEDTDLHRELGLVTASTIDSLYGHVLEVAHQVVNERDLGHGKLGDLAI